MGVIKKNSGVHVKFYCEGIANTEHCVQGIWWMLPNYLNLETKIGMGIDWNLNLLREAVNGFC